MLPTLSLLLLIALAVLLFIPLLGLGRVPVWIVVALLVARLALQVVRARTEGGPNRIGGWLIDVVLIGVLVYVAVTGRG